MTLCHPPHTLVSAPVYAHQNQGQVRTHPVILRQHDLIALKLTAHPEHLHLQLVDHLRILVTVLLELLKAVLLLGEPLALSLLALLLLRLDLLLELLLAAALLLGLLLRLERAACPRTPSASPPARGSLLRPALVLPVPLLSAAWAARAPAHCPVDSVGLHELRDVDEPCEILEIRALKVELA